ncbi:hypothetical protein EGW08_006759 [Elysia chlorotica]|uniref:28S ribosomal protein S18a, mitochondrial n=1 Tax=Elysia chlorotica TaxID=188477 RepID=A0A3S1BP71_ELYCH|nr:hypothetical protein EGW08_006759 [Elysia chlorotica]
MATPMNAAKSVTLRHFIRLFAFPQEKSKHFSTTRLGHVKKIEVKKTDLVTVIEGVKLEEDNSKTFREIKAPTGCPLCEFQNSLTYRDVLILQQFLSPDGKILPRHVTGVCYTMQWKLQNILYQSYSAGLLPKYCPELPVNEDPTHYLKNYKWRKNNVYYEDFSIENPL